MSEIKVGLIGGTGLGEAMRARAEGVRHEVETPFGRPSDVIVETEWAGLPVLFLSRHGPGHLLNPTQVPYRANIFALKKLGCTHIIASGAVGSLREELRPRDLVVVDQVIDKTSRRAGTFYERAAVHVELAEPFCPVVRRMLLEDSGSGVQGSESDDASAEPGTEKPYRLHDRGCYVCMEGPGFSTRAESLMHRLWGGDVIGMTAMPEARLAREAEIGYALVALVTDYDCWKARGEKRSRKPEAGSQKTEAGSQGDGGRMPRHGEAAGEDGANEAQAADLLAEIMGNLQAASDHAVELIVRTVERMAGRRDELLASPAREALKLGIWSEKSLIEPEEIERLRPLWGKYF